MRNLFSGRIIAVILSVLAWPGLTRPMTLSAQEPAAAQHTLDSLTEAGEVSANTRHRQMIRWNELDGRFMTLRVGAGFNIDAVSYAQDDASAQQFRLEPDIKPRDARLLLKGKFKTTRPVTYSMGIMYDGATDRVLFRETGIMVAVPELWGHVFLGRTKEGFSLNKVMVGYAGWTMERSTMNDASIPILADGLKWLGYLPGHRLIWNVGWYHDWVSEGQSFSSYDQQVVVRIAGLPVLADAEDALLHLGANLRWGRPDDGYLRLRSRPESNPTPYFVDTDRFPAEYATHTGWEVYCRMGSWLFGHEYWFQQIGSPSTGDPVVQGGDVALTWLITGETRAYNTTGGFFREVSPARTVFEGGPGAWEAVFRYSRIDLDNRGIQGGKFWRVTPMVNWYLSDQLRLEFVYGYGGLSRFGLDGKTQFFQTRFQIWI